MFYFEASLFSEAITSALVFVKRHFPVARHNAQLESGRQRVLGSDLDLPLRLRQQRLAESRARRETTERHRSWRDHLTGK